MVGVFVEHLVRTYGPQFQNHFPVRKKGPGMNEGIGRYYAHWAESVARKSAQISCFRRPIYFNLRLSEVQCLLQGSPPSLIRFQALTLPHRPTFLPLTHSQSAMFPSYGRWEWTPFRLFQSGFQNIRYQRTAWKSYSLKKGGYKGRSSLPSRLISETVHDVKIYWA